MESRLTKALGDNSTVAVELVAADGAEYLLERPFLVGDESSWLLRRYLEDGDLVTVDVHPSEVLQISAFSQGEALEYSREKVGRMALVDAALDLSEIESTLIDLTERLRENGSRLLEQRENLAVLEVELSAETSLRAREAELSPIFEGDIVERQRAWESDNTRVTQVLDSIPKSHQIEFRLDHERVAPEHEPNKELLERAAGIVERANAAISEALAKLDEALASAHGEATNLRTEWTTKYEAFGVELASKLDSVEGDRSLAALSAQLGEVQRKLLQIQSTKNQIEDVERPKLDEIQAEREAILRDIMKSRQERRQLRRDRIKELNRRTNNIVKLDLPTDGDSASFRAKLDEIKVGSRVKEKALDAIAGAVHPAQFAEAMLDGSYADLVDADKGVELDALSRLYVNIGDKELEAELLEVQEIDRADRLEIKFQRDSGGYAPIESLAHGQKCTAILVVLLADGQTPVIVDQPEDALHAPWIEDHLVDRLRSLRGQRQYIFATRSPGIVVSADAEQITTLSASAGKGTVEASGSLERHDLNKLVLHHLEGGPAALERRHRKLSPSLID